MNAKTKTNAAVSTKGSTTEPTGLIGEDGKLDVKRAQQILAKALSKQYEASSTILRAGDRISIPTWMSLESAAKAIREYVEQQEEDIQILAEFDCHPDDGAVQFFEAVKETFGNLLGAATQTFFGKIPGKMMSIDVAYGQTVQVPVGLTEVPGLPIKMQLRPQYDDKHVNGGKFDVIFSCQRKYEPLCKDIERLTRERLSKFSIFRGKAIDSQYKFLNLGNFDPNRLVYSERVSLQIDANVLSPIRDAALWRKSGSSLKRGILLSGPYGTGKTLTARAVAVVCETHGWTFINVRPGDDIMKALQFAKRYMPAVVFFEDIDQQTSGGRDERLNQILNTVDGVVGKSDELITILTTNHVELVNKAMLRPGRLDSLIVLGELDAQAMDKLVRASLYDAEGRNMLVGDLDGERLLNAASGYLPAFIVEAVTKAKAYAMSRGAFQTDGSLAIRTEDVENALIEVRPQFDLMQGEQKVEVPALDRVLSGMVERKVESVMSPKLEELKEWMENNLR